MPFDQINPNIAHIQDGSEYFQVLNQAGDDWDEAATVVLYNAWQAENT
jgi:hypothetical protein